MRSLTGEITARRGGRAVVLSRGHLAGRRLVARSPSPAAPGSHTATGRAQLTLHATDDTGHTLTARRALRLRGR